MRLTTYQRCAVRAGPYIGLLRQYSKATQANTTPIYSQHGDAIQARVANRVRCNIAAGVYTIVGSIDVHDVQCDMQLQMGIVVDHIHGISLLKKSLCQFQ